MNKAITNKFGSVWKVEYRVTNSLNNPRAYAVTYQCMSEILIDQRLSDAEKLLAREYLLRQLFFTPVGCISYFAWTPEQQEEEFETNHEVVELSP